MLDNRLCENIKFSDKVMKTMTEAMKNEKMELIAECKSLAEENIQKGIFLVR